MDTSRTETIGAGATFFFPGGREVAILAAGNPVQVVAVDFYGQRLCDFTGCGAGFHYKFKEEAQRVEVTSSNAGNVVTVASISAGALVRAKG